MALEGHVKIYLLDCSEMTDLQGRMTITGDYKYEELLEKTKPLIPFMEKDSFEFQTSIVNDFSSYGETLIAIPEYILRVEYNAGVRVFMALKNYNEPSGFDFRETRPEEFLLNFRQALKRQEFQRKFAKELLVCSELPEVVNENSSLRVITEILSGSHPTDLNAFKPLDRAMTKKLLSMSLETINALVVNVEDQGEYIFRQLAHHNQAFLHNLLSTTLGLDVEYYITSGFIRSPKRHPFGTVDYYADAYLSFDEQLLGDDEIYFCVYSSYKENGSMRLKLEAFVFPNELKQFRQFLFDKFVKYNYK